MKTLQLKMLVEDIVQLAAAELLGMEVADEAASHSC